MSHKRNLRVFRHGCSQAVRIPKEFEFSERRVIMRKVGKRLILEPAAQQRELAEVLSNLSPLSAEEWLPDVDGLQALDSNPLA